ncbi:hypothetical protein ABW19_dt0206930 [Dactylella cylindrospora]|nr:hypothetical protein ABW19_dt0206930 [Dactylella cylindrospora]
MNSLNILSSQVDRVIGNTPPSTPRSEAAFASEFFSQAGKDEISEVTLPPSSSYEEEHEPRDNDEEESETAALLSKSDSDGNYGTDTSPSIAPPTASPVKRLWRKVRASISWVVACFYDDNNHFSLLAPVHRVTLFLIRPFGARKYEISALQESRPSISDKSFNEKSEISPQSADIPGSSILNEKSDPSSSTLQVPADEIAPRRSIRIRLFSSDKQQKPKSIKSPTSPSSSLRLTRYPRLSGPPRPLLPKTPPQKTLILDLDETLIHSMSKGGSMSAAHMVEVKLDRQHAILYYVHKRPFCDEFLKKVCKWYNVVIFTASVQEYADPVIDWLDQEHKFFRARYYRQHCTFRDGVYIKDLSVVEPDLSKVMIVDNSPTSYIFHKDNAIPIEGWISDPSDHHLLHLIPILQALQYVTDVRAFLALRMGEAAT